MKAKAVFLGSLLAALGCREETSFERPTPSFERMIKQPRWDAFEARDTSLAPARLLPPAGSVPYGLGGAAAQVSEEFDHVPLPLDMDGLKRGKRLYGIYCTPCHGADGQGKTLVTRFMAHPPDPLFEHPLLEGKIFRVASDGLKNMPSFATQLSYEERWLVVAFVQALALEQRSQRSQTTDENPKDAATHKGVAP